MAAKTLLIVFIILVLGALFLGLYYLYRDHGKGQRTLTALLFRVGFTLVLIFMLLISLWMGWLKLHPVGDLQNINKHEQA